jgi:hypothetical protein
LNEEEVVTNAKIPSTPKPEVNILDIGENFDVTELLDKTGTTVCGLYLKHGKRGRYYNLFPEFVIAHEFEVFWTTLKPNIHAGSSNVATQIPRAPNNVMIL